MQSLYKKYKKRGNDDLKKLLKSKEISEDDEKKFSKIIQDHTDDNIKIVMKKFYTKKRK